MADEQHPYADPWGLPTEETPITEEAPDEVVEAESAGAAPEITSGVPDEAEAEPPAEDTSERIPEGETISPAQVEAKNVLETLGAGIEDLPDELPDWVETGTAPRVYQELADLDSIAGSDVEVPVEEATEAETETAEEPVGEEVEETETIEEPVEMEPDLDETVEAETEPNGNFENVGTEFIAEPDEEGGVSTEESLEEEIETTDDVEGAEVVTETDLGEPIEEPAELEPNLDETVASALSAIEAPESDLVEPTEEPAELEPNLDETVASALSAFEAPESDLVEPTEEPVEQEMEPNLDEAVASALSAFETPESDLVEPTDIADLDEPTEEAEPDLDEAVASALSAFETPESDLVEPIEEPAELEPDLDETVASALSAIGIPASDLGEPTEEPVEEEAEPPEASPAESELIESPTVAWGSAWSSAAQGWIRQDDGRSTWRPIVTTTSDVGAWEVDTFLGIVSGDASISDAGNLAGARRTALQSLVDEALARGAHAVVGVRTSVHEVGRSAVFSAVGTAVTLRNPS